MPSSHPIPTIAALALSLYASDRRVEKLPTVTEHTGYVEISPCSETEKVRMMRAVSSLYRAGEIAFPSMGGDL